MNYLILRLKAPFQSYGIFGKWEYRDTSIFPTKSAIIGILGSALGLCRGSKELIKLSESLRINIRADRVSSQLVDFQIVSGEHKKAEDILHGKGNSEKTEIKIERKIVRKEYLEDSAYTVFLGGDIELLKKLDEAIRNPIWNYSLGRANCICSRPIYSSKTEIGLISTEVNIIELMKTIPLIATPKTETIQIEIEVPLSELNNYSEEIIIESLTNTGNYVGASYNKYYAYRGFINKEEILKEC